MLEKLPTFVPGLLFTDVSINTERETIYTRYGDWFEKVILGLAAAGALLSLAASLVMWQGKTNRK
ncbi:MAG: hypothetical protein P1P77_11915 [Spirochaetaceae bacterium]|nr:hypothetical protein [Spirochaetaceae bacterium]